MHPSAVTYFTFIRIYSSISPLAVIIDEMSSERLRSHRRFSVTFASLDDRTLHQDVPRESERLGVAEACFLAERTDDRADVLQVEGRSLPEAMAVAAAELEQDIDERAPFEVVALEPLIEEVEDREKLLLRRAAALPCLSPPT